MLSTRGYLPITKKEIKKIFQKVSGGRNQFKYVKKVQFLWVLHEIMKLVWPRLHADQINFEREMHSHTALTAFRRCACKYVRGDYEGVFRPQYKILDPNGSIAYQLWSNRQQRAFAEDEFGANYNILAIVVEDWVPLTQEEDEDGMYDFGTGYEPMPLRQGMVLHVKEGMYNDNSFNNDDENDFLDDDAYFSPMRRTMDVLTGCVSSENEVANIDVEGVKVFYGQETTAGGVTGIFPTNCVRLTRVDYMYRTNLEKTKAVTRLQGLFRGFLFRLRRVRWW